MALAAGDRPANPTTGSGDQQQDNTASTKPPAAKNPWREVLAPYARPHLGRSTLDLATSVLPYVALWPLMLWSLDVSYLLTLAVAVVAGGFLVRTYIIFHDCTHGSFLRTKRANTWMGSAVGLLVFSNFQSWKHNHAIHHATAGDLDRRGIGDVACKTVAEYNAMDRKAQRGYRMYRNPWVMFGLGPIFSLLVQPRLVPKDARPRIKRSVIATNVALGVLVVGICLLVGWREYLLIQFPAVMVGGAAGIWLFYVQHQFEDVYWENRDGWSYADAALRGSSYLRLPKVLQFFSGNIGLHHVHHLSARIPNYNLQRAHDENPIFHDVPTLSFMDGMRCVRLKLYDSDSGRMVTFAEARREDGGRGAQRTQLADAVSGA